MLLFQPFYDSCIEFSFRSLSRCKYKLSNITSDNPKTPKPFFIRLFECNYKNLAPQFKKKLDLQKKLSRDENFKTNFRGEILKNLEIFQGFSPAPFPCLSNFLIYLSLCAARK